jgi:hypothetical protein
LREKEKREVNKPISSGGKVAMSTNSTKQNKTVTSATRHESNQFYCFYFHKCIVVIKVVKKFKENNLKPKKISIPQRNLFFSFDDNQNLIINKNFIFFKNLPKEIFY